MSKVVQMEYTNDEWAEALQEHEKASQETIRCEENFLLAEKACEEKEEELSKLQRVKDDAEEELRRARRELSEATTHLVKVKLGLDEN